MKKQTEKALIAKAERIAEQSGETMYATMFLNGAGWYHNNVWHKVCEKPDEDSRVVLLITDIPSLNGEHKYAVEFQDVKNNWESVKKLRNFSKWAYIEDILPNRKEDNA